MRSSPPQDNGLAWVQNTFDLEPRWTRDIRPEQIAEAIEKAISKTPSHIKLLAQGAFNKIYTLQIDGIEQIIRISLPVDPSYKTASEIATISWVRAYISLPLPKIFAYQNQWNNPIGFEWILMSKLPGATLSSAWESISLEAKLAIVHHLAVAKAALFRNQLQGIGNIYPDKQGSLQCGSKRPETARIVSMEFFWNSRLQFEVPRGPFRSSSAWTTARLSLIEQECRSKLASSEDEYDLEDAERTLNIVLRLQDFPSIVFGADNGQLEPSMLHHNDLSEHNILVDEKGQLTGVLDWECVSALPLWKACSYPSFLSGSDRGTQPNKDRYGRESSDEISDLYQEHYKQYELTLLRRYFIEEMSALEPEWIHIFNASQMKKDFDIAINHCDSEFSARRINRWIDAVLSSNKELFCLEDELMK